MIFIEGKEVDINRFPDGTLLLKEDVKNTLIRYFDEFTKRRYGAISGFVYYMSIKEDFFSKHLLSIYRYEKK